MSSLVVPYIGFKWLKSAKNNLTWSDFTNFLCKFLHIQIASISGHSVNFIFKTCQIVAGTSMTHQFHGFFNLILGGFLTFGTTVCHSILPRPLWLLRAKLLLSFSSLDSSRQEDYDRWYYFLVEKLRSKQKLLPVFSNLLASSVVFEFVLWSIWCKNQNLYKPKKLVKLQQLLGVLLDCSCVKFKREKLETV